MFTKGKSCRTDSISFFRKVNKAVDRDENYDITYLDFSKVFKDSSIKLGNMILKEKYCIRLRLGRTKDKRVTINGKKS